MRILLRFSVGFVAAAFATLTVCTGWFALICICLLLLTGLFPRFRSSGTWPFVLGLAIGLTWTNGYQYLALKPTQHFIGCTVDAHATAIDYSSPTAYGIRVPAELEVEGRTVKAMVWLYTDKEICPGDTFSTAVEFRDPDGEDSLYYRSEGYFLKAHGKGEPDIRTAMNHPIRFYPRYAAHALDVSLRRCMPEDTLGYSLALVTGNRSGLSLSQKSAMKTAGIYHMMALSGMHLAVLIGAVCLFARHKKAKAVLGISVSILFALVTGASASIIRAAIMQSLVLLAPLLGREEDTPTSLGFAALIIIAQNPWSVFGLGLQLSFCSMAGIMLFSDRIYRKMKGKRRFRGRLGVLCSYVFRTLAMSFSAMAFSFPLLMYSAGRASLISPLSCLLTGAVVTWCFRGSILTALFGLICKPVGILTGWITSWLIRFVQLASALLSRIPFAAVTAGNMYFLVWIVVLYTVLLLAAFSREKSVRPVIPACCILICLAAALTGSIADNLGTSMTALDVGQGQCLLFRMDGRTVLMDCGGSSGEATGDLAADHLSDMGVDGVDVLILTHFDSDHTAGVPELLFRMPVSMIMIPDLEDPVSDEIQALAASFGCEIHCVTTETVLKTGTGQITLFPPLFDDNNACLSALFQTRSLHALVTGDIDARQEQVLLHTYDIPAVDILVAGHHGSAGSTSQSLLNAVSPQIAVISVGRNHYGHPADETLKRLRDSGAEVFRTDLCGTITLKGE